MTERQAADCVRGAQPANLASCASQDAEYVAPFITVTSPLGAQTYWTHYVSTYCIHGLHGDCRLTCKTCKAPCRCECHAHNDGPGTGNGGA